jgi:hypothetical protein
MVEIMLFVAAVILIVIGFLAFSAGIMMLVNMI